VKNNSKIETYCNFVGGRLTQSDHKLLVKDKYTDLTIGEAFYLDESDFETVLSATLEGFDSLKKISLEQRSEYLNSLFLNLKNKREEFANLISKEAGKPITYAYSEVDRCLATIKIGVEETLRINGEVIPMGRDNCLEKQAYTQLFPKGPVFAISPFNFPLNLALHKIVPAIASGCSIVIKPSPLAPLSLLKFSEIISESKIPKGVVNIIVCEDLISQKFLNSDIFKTFSFTGSPAVGWNLKKLAGKKNVLLELGGNAAVIVDETSENLSEIARNCAIGSFLYAGQICISTQRIYVSEIIYQEFKQLIINEIKHLKMGNPTDKETQVGPLISKDHLERINLWVKEAIKNGAKLLIGGEIQDVEHNLFKPTLIEDVSKNSKLYYEEAFGPVATLESFKSFEEAIEKVNDSKFGLQVGVFTNNIKNMKKSFKDLNVGAVLINSIPGFRIDHMPYGGVKDSGLGREGIKYSIEEFSEKKLLIY